MPQWLLHQDPWNRRAVRRLVVDWSGDLGKLCRCRVSLEIFRKHYYEHPLMPSPTHPSFQAAPTAAIPAYLHPQAVDVTLHDRARKRIKRITQNVTPLGVASGIAGHGF
jgi:hypothetical protein